MTNPITANDEHLAFLTLYRAHESRMTMARVEEIEVEVTGSIAVGVGILMVNASLRYPDKLIIMPRVFDRSKPGFVRAKVVILDMVDARDD